MPGAVLRKVVARPVTTIPREPAPLPSTVPSTIISRIVAVREQLDPSPKPHPRKGQSAARLKPRGLSTPQSVLTTDAGSALRLPLLLQWGLQFEQDPRLCLRKDTATVIALWSSSLFILKHPLMSATINLEANTVAKAIKGPPLPLYSWRAKSPSARLVYTRNAEEANAELEKLRPGPLGFDMEWKPNYVVGQIPNPVALVQLANDDLVILVQVSAMRTFPAKLREVLGDPSYVKAGVSIKNDVEKLYRDHSVITRNCVELSYLARTVDNPRWNGPYRSSLGLNTLCEAYQELSLQKGKITRSNWERVLTEAQQHYAANDSHSGYTTYRILAAMAAAMSPAPLLAWYSFDFVGTALEPETGMAWVPNNPNYDPGPERVPVVKEGGDQRRKKKGRKGVAQEGPTASNVSASTERSIGVGRGLFRPPPHVGPSRYVTSIRSPEQQPGDIPLFVSRDSPDYERFRSLGEANQSSRPFTRGQKPDGPPLLDDQGENVDVQAGFGIRRSSTDSLRFERGESSVQRTPSGSGRPYPPHPRYTPEQPPPRPAHLIRGRSISRPSSPPLLKGFGIALHSSRESGPSSHVQRSSSNERRPGSPGPCRRLYDDERSDGRREYSRERSERNASPHRSTSPTQRAQFGLARSRPPHAPDAPEGRTESFRQINEDTGDMADGTGDMADGPGHRKSWKPRRRRGRPLPG